MINTNNNVTIYDERTAYDFLEDMGMDKWDIEEFKTLICGSEIENARHSEEVARQEFHAMEAYVDHVQSMVNEIIDIVDDALKMERISKPRERFEAITRLINEYV